MNMQAMTVRALGCAGLTFTSAIGGTAAVAHAEQVVIPDVVQSTTTVDGWQMTLSMTEARINVVPNMAAAPLSREGFLSGRVTLTIEGDGSSAVNSGQIVVGAQLGCQADLSEGLDLGVDFDTDLFDDDFVLGVGPDVGTTLHSGGIEAVGFGTKPLKGRLATIYIRDAHIQVDECGGAVTARLFASAQMSTDVSDDSLNVYGEVLPL